MTTAFINVHQLHRHYSEGTRKLAVLEGADLQVKRGETVALLGRSGSGKSTLLNLISGIDQPNSGSVIIDGQELTALSEQRRTLFRRANIGFIYQSFNLITTLTAAENILLPLELNRLPRQQANLRVAQLLAAVGLAQRADTFPDQLSGGEQQRIAIARALIHQPALVLADEPTGNLDAETGKRIMSLLYQLVEDRDSTLLVVTHSLAVAQSADRIVTLEKGQLAERTGDFAW